VPRPHAVVRYDDLYCRHRAILLIPFKLGGYSAVFETADGGFSGEGVGGILLTPAQFAPYVSSRSGPALASSCIRMQLTGFWQAPAPISIRKNAILLPAIRKVLALLASWV